MRGDIVFYANRPGIMSKLIGWATDSMFTHVAVMHSDDTVAEMTTHGMRISPSRLNGDTIKLRPPYPMAEKNERLQKAVAKHIGKKYGWWQAIMVGLEEKTGWKRFKARKGTICSEFVADYVKDWIALPNVNTISPDELFDLLQPTFKLIDADEWLERPIK